VALKILTADSYGTGHDTFELDILRHIRAKGTSHTGASHILGLLDEFEHRGPHGNHVCLVLKAMGPDMAKYRRLFPKGRIPLATMKTIARQLLLALDFLHRTCSIIHTGQCGPVLPLDRASSLTVAVDIKPQNILLDTPAINEMFKKAPSQVFTPQIPPLDPPNDFYRQSEQLSSGEEDLADATDILIMLADFGTGMEYTSSVFLTLISH
jgi:serine/threonine-protein kinase SRPK3